MKKTGVYKNVLKCKSIIECNKAALSLALLICCFVGGGVKSQTTIQVGTLASTSTYPLLSQGAAYNYSQQIYKSTDGLATYSGQYITAIRFYWNGGGDLTNSNSWSIYFANSTKTSFTNTTNWESFASFTQVYNGGVSLPITAGWFTIVLDSPFQYSGNSIIVAIDENSAGTASSSATFKYTTSASTLLAQRSASDINPSAPGTAVYGPANRADVQFDFFNSATPANVVSVNATSGTPSRSYPSLSYAFDAINSGAHKGDIVLNVGSSNNESFTFSAMKDIIASGVGSASYTGILVRPAYANITINSNLAASTFRLCNATNIIFDGRIGSAGTTKDLTIENSNTGTSSKGAIELYGASNCNIRYCNLKSSTTSTSGGYGTVSLNYNTNSGPSNNLIEYCNITKSGTNMPFVAIASSNTSSTYYSQGNTVRFCNISDFKRAGIWLGNSGSVTYNNLWTINNNSFYQTSSFGLNTTDYANHAIYIGYHASGTLTSTYNDRGAYTISNNIIGGDGMGGNWAVTGSSTSNFVSPIYIAASNASAGINMAAYSEINGNVIQNFDVETQYFAGICADKTKLKIGSTIGNTISGIVLKHPAAAGGTASGIYVNTSSDYSNEIKNNTISFSTSTGNNYNNLYGIINICSTTHPKDIVSSNVVSNIDATKANTAYGIYTHGYISQNHISKIKFSGINPLYGIYWLGGQAIGLDYRVENNEVILGLDNSGSSTAINSDIYGICSNRSEINLFYNSVLLQGVATTKNSYCLRLNSNSTGYVVKNNLLYNERSGGSGNHYCISTAFTTTSYWSSSNNAYVLYSGSKAAYYLGDWGGTGKTSLTDWASASNETNSISETTTNKPVASLLPNVSGSNNLLPFNDKWLCAGAIVAPTTDFTGLVANNRHNPAPTTIGAYELDCPVLLPIELLSFSCISVENKKVLLNWVTASELNNDFFTIERSLDGTTFEKIDYIDGAGNSNTELSYTAIDETPFDGINYYRLKQTDFDGTCSYSQIIFLDIANQNFNIRIFPNPFSEYLEINFNDQDAMDVDITVINAMGQEIPITFLKSEINKRIISFPSEITQGYYFIKVKSNNQCKFYKTFKI